MWPNDTHLEVGILLAVDQLQDSQQEVVPGNQRQEVVVHSRSEAVALGNQDEGAVAPSNQVADHSQQQVVVVAQGNQDEGVVVLGNQQGEAVAHSPQGVADHNQNMTCLVIIIGITTTALINTRVLATTHLNPRLIK